MVISAKTITHNKEIYRFKSDVQIQCISCRVLINCTMGVIRKLNFALHREQLKTGDLPDVLYISFDDKTVWSNIKDAEGLIETLPVSVTFQAINPTEM